MSPVGWAGRLWGGLAWRGGLAMIPRGRAPAPAWTGNDRDGAPGPKGMARGWRRASRAALRPPIGQAQLGRGVPRVAAGWERLAARHDLPAIDLDPIAEAGRHRAANKRGTGVAVVEAGDPYDILVGRAVD